MSKIKVQCKGSGSKLNVGPHIKRGACPFCGKMKDLTSAGRIKRHDRITSKSKLK